MMLISRQERTISPELLQKLGVPITALTKSNEFLLKMERSIPPGLLKEADASRPVFAINLACDELLIPYDIEIFAKNSFSKYGTYRSLYGKCCSLMGMESDSRLTNPLSLGYGENYEKIMHTSKNLIELSKSFWNQSEDIQSSNLYHKAATFYLVASKENLGKQYTKDQFINLLNLDKVLFNNTLGLYTPMYDMFRGNSISEGEVPRESGRKTVTNNKEDLPKSIIRKWSDLLQEPPSNKSNNISKENESPTENCSDGENLKKKLNKRSRKSKKSVLTQSSHSLKDAHKRCRIAQPLDAPDLQPDHSTTTTSSDTLSTFLVNLKQKRLSMLQANFTINDDKEGVLKRRREVEIFENWKGLMTKRFLKQDHLARL